MELERFIGKYGKDIYSFCCFLTKNKEEADDLYQESFIKIIYRKQLPDNEVDVKRLILSETVRLWKDKKRKFAWRKHIVEEKYVPQEMQRNIEEHGNIPEEHIVKNEEAEYIRNCVNRLPDKMRLVISLYYMENFNMMEIAEVLHIPLGTVKSRLHQAKKILAGELEDYYRKGGME